MAYVLGVSRRVSGVKVLWDVEIIMNERREVFELNRRQLERSYLSQIPRFTVQAHSDISYSLFPNKYLITLITRAPTRNVKLRASGYKNGNFIQHELEPEKLQNFLYRFRKEIILVGTPKEQRFLLLKD